MNKSIPIILVVLLIVVFGLYQLKKSKSEVNGNNETVEATEIQSIEDDVFYLFVGNTCPHCKDVEQFIEENQLKEKVNIKIVEVFEEKENQKYYIEAHKLCGVEEVESISVPVLYRNGECFDGSQEAENALKEAAGIE